jgi:6-phosphogluconate dehydrogenase
MSKRHQRYCFSPLRQVLTSLNFIVAMIGCRSMGGGLALLFAEHGVSVSLHDPSSVVMDGVIESAKQQNIDPVPSKHLDSKSLCSSPGSPKVFFFSLPHGIVGWSRT